MNGKRELDFRKKWIQWALDFAQADLNSLSKSRLRGRCVELFYFSCLVFRNQNFEEFLRSFALDKLPEIKIDNFDEEKLTALRRQLPDEKPRLVSPNEELENILSELEAKLQDLQDALRDFIEEAQNILSKPLKKISPITRREYTSTEILLPETENRLDIRKIRGDFYWCSVVVPKDYSYRNWAILNLASLMDQLSIYAIKRCEGCNRYFLNASARQKIYCSSSCASRSIAHKKYEELKKNPRKYKAHLKKYRKYSEERYKRLREMQYGPNVKIQKRKNRRKEG